jgi:transcription elongation factor GreA
MTVTERIWMTPQARSRLEAELVALRSHPSSEDRRDLMEYDDTRVANHAARQTRIRQVEDLLTQAVVGEDPPDDGVAEPGMVLTVRYDDTGEVETFLLGVRGAEDAHIEVYSLQSPLGTAIAGALPGEQRAFSVPNGKNLTVTLVNAVPYAAGTTNSSGTQTVPV